MMVTLNKVKPNPYRDFDLDPLNDEVVAKMKASISDMEFWGGLAVREVADGYELAFGHHRLEALKQLGRTSEDLKIVAFDDDMMVKAMVAENALQRGGDTTAHLDAVAAICTRIIYKVLSCKGDAEEVAIIIATSLNAAQQLVASVDRGQPISERTVLAFDTGLSAAAVREALASLTDAGHFRIIHTTVREKIAAERREEAAQAKREKLAKAEIKRREEEAEEAEEEAEEQRERAKPIKGVTEAYDIKVAQVFSNDSHSKAFREIVTSSAGKEFVPLDQQVRLAAEVKEKIVAKHGTRGLTAVRVGEYTNNGLLEMGRFKREAKKKLEEEIASEAATRRWNEIVLAVSKIATSLEGLDIAMEKCGGDFVRKTDAVTLQNMNDFAQTKLSVVLAHFNTTINLVSVQEKQ